LCLAWVEMPSLTRGKTLLLTYGEITFWKKNKTGELTGRKGKGRRGLLRAKKALSELGTVIRKEQCVPAERATRRGEELFISARGAASRGLSRERGGGVHPLLERLEGGKKEERTLCFARRFYIAVHHVDRIEGEKGEGTALLTRDPEKRCSRNAVVSRGGTVVLSNT